MRRIIAKLTAIGVLGSSLGLAGALAFGQPASAGLEFPPDIESGQEICIGWDIGTEVDGTDIQIEIRASEICAMGFSFLGDPIYIQRG